MLRRLEKEQPEISNNDEAVAMYEKLAERRVALGLILAEITSRDEMIPAPRRLRQRLNKLAESYEDPSSFIEWYKSDRKRLSEIEAQVLESMVVDKLLKDAEISR